MRSRPKCAAIAIILTISADGNAAGVHAAADAAHQLRSPSKDARRCRASPATSQPSNSSMTACIIFHRSPAFCFQHRGFVLSGSNHSREIRRNTSRITIWCMSPSAVSRVDAIENNISLYQPGSPVVPTGGPAMRLQDRLPEHARRSVDRQQHYHRDRTFPSATRRDRVSRLSDGREFASRPGIAIKRSAMARLTRRR